MKWLKKAAAVLSAAVLTATMCVQAVFGAVTYEPDSFTVSAQAAYLINTDTDTLIYAKNENEQLPPASLTKIMTAILVLEKYRGEDESSTEQNLSEVVVTAPGYIFYDLFTLNASTADIRRGEEVRMLDLLYALLLP